MNIEKAIKNLEEEKAAREEAERGKKPGPTYEQLAAMIEEAEEEVRLLRKRLTPEEIDERDREWRKTWPGYPEGSTRREIWEQMKEAHERMRREGKIWWR